MSVFKDHKMSISEQHLAHNMNVRSVKHINGQCYLLVKRDITQDRLENLRIQEFKVEIEQEE